MRSGIAQQDPLPDEAAGTRRAEEGRVRRVADPKRAPARLDYVGTVDERHDGPADEVDPAEFHRDDRLDVGH